MKFKISRAKFIEGLGSVQNIVEGKVSLSILQNVRLETANNELSLVTTDLDISVKTTCECTTLEPGLSTMPVKLLYTAISKMAEGEIEMEIDSHERATITAGHARYKLAGMPVENFPKLPVTEDAYAYKVPQAVFKEMLRKVSYAASQDEARRTLKGVLVSFKDMKITMAATDGRRLALVENEMEFPKDAERDIVLPSKAVAVLQRSLDSEGDIELMVQKTQICFNIGSTTMYSKLIDEVYPNYRQVIPHEMPEHIEVDRELLLAALDRAGLMSMGVANSTKLIFESGKLTVTSVATDIGEAKDMIPIKYAGEKIEIILNHAYVMDCLKAIDDDEVTINIKDGHSPAIIKCQIPFLYLLMPLRTN